MGTLRALMMFGFVGGTASCASSRQAEKSAFPELEGLRIEMQRDTSEFVPLHPPVVVPKHWLELFEGKEKQ